MGRVTYCNYGFVSWHFSLLFLNTYKKNINKQKSRPSVNIYIYIYMLVYNTHTQKLNGKCFLIIKGYRVPIYVIISLLLLPAIYMKYMTAKREPINEIEKLINFY